MDTAALLIVGGGGGGGRPEGCQSRHIHVNPMFDCVMFVKVCVFAEIKSIQKVGYVQCQHSSVQLVLKK